MIKLIAKEDKVINRSLSILKLKSLDEHVDYSNLKYFIVLLVDKLKDIDINKLSLFITKLLDSGMINLCSWGNNCELIHDLTDEIICDPKNSEKYNLNDENSLIMTSWHDDESLEDALFYSLFTVLPSDNYFDKTNNFLAITINDDVSYNLIENYLKDIKSFNRLVCG